MSFWRFVTSTELRWSLGLLGFASAPIVCVYQLYVESQAGKISLKDSGTLRELAPEQATPEKEPLFKGGIMDTLGPEAAAEATDKLLSRLLGEGKGDN